MFQALYRKVDALGELCDWHEAEEVHVQASVAVHKAGQLPSHVSGGLEAPGHRRRRLRTQDPV